jgi:hypothetical protein
MYLATRRKFYSAALSTEATAPLMFLPSWNKRMTISPAIHIALPQNPAHTQFLGFCVLYHYGGYPEVFSW